MGLTTAKGGGMSKLEPVYARFGVAVACLRAKVGLSQTELGDAIGLSRISIANIEAGKQRMPLHTALGLAKALGRSLGDMLSMDTSAFIESQLKRERERTSMLQRQIARTKRKIARLEKEA